MRDTHRGTHVNSWSATTRHWSNDITGVMSSNACIGGIRGELTIKVVGEDSRKEVFDWTAKEHSVLLMEFRTDWESVMMSMLRESCQRGVVRISGYQLFHSGQ